MKDNDKVDGRKPGSDSLVGVPKHKVATGVGAVVGAAAAGAAVGTVAGPVGTVVGAVAGAVAGGLGADAVAGSFSQADEKHWKDNFSSRPYVKAGARYQDYGPAYAYGTQASSRHGGGTFDSVETELSQGWTSARGGSTLEWDHARAATRDAYDRKVSDARRPM
jgi:hypothetical protein